MLASALPLSNGTLDLPDGEHGRALDISTPVVDDCSEAYDAEVREGPRHCRRGPHSHSRLTPKLRGCLGWQRERHLGRRHVHIVRALVAPYCARGCDRRMCAVALLLHRHAPSLGCPRRTASAFIL